jgi:hypothetical protein
MAVIMWQGEKYLKLLYSRNMFGFAELSGFSSLPITIILITKNWKDDKIKL